MATFSLWLSLWLFLLGAAAGLLYDLFSFLKRVSKNNLLVCFALDQAVCLMTLGGFILCVFNFSSGNFAFFEVVCLIFGIVIEQIFIKNVLAISLNAIYNKITYTSKRKTLRGKKNDKSKAYEPG